MSVALITERIAASIIAGKLPHKPDNVTVDQLTMADLLRPWGEIFPGQSYAAERNRNLFDYGKLRKPHFTPLVRRSRRPLCAPRHSLAPAKLVSPGLFASVRAISDWYLQEGVAEYDLGDHPFNKDSLEDFIEPLRSRGEEYWPLSLPIENLYWDGSLSGLENISLMLPHFHYDEECAGMVEAFLSGAGGIEWLMDHYNGISEFLDLPDEDRALIKDVGFGALADQYALRSDGRTYNLELLENHQDEFFGPVWKAFPEQEKREDIEPSIISGESGTDAEVIIMDSLDIDFCLAYAKAFYKMVDAMPDPRSFEENDLGITETFAHELCEVWRADHGQPSVVWTSPQASEVTYE